jgi:hypothetical protein
MLTAQSLGLLVGALVTNPKIGQTIVSVLALSMVLVSRSFYSPAILDHSVECHPFRTGTHLYDDYWADHPTTLKLLI